MAEKEDSVPLSADDDPTLLSSLRSGAGLGDVSRKIGPYRLLRPLGEGGMGVVWEAEQTEPIERRVALKLIKLGMDTKQFSARFDSERQALARMEHPCIARVIDGGATDAGRPYFVMELVKGVPITVYCEREQLSLRDRLRLFLQVCAGVQHAHQKGIIHRDLKPSNVLITELDGKPTPKIIDFGVAKATSSSLSDQTVQTVVGGWIGTPAYMSPEQAEITDDIDTRTDVYSLGVMLYELLTGQRPFEPSHLQSAGFDEIRRLIRDVDPARPSTRVSGEPDQKLLGRSRGSSSMRRRLRGDLDWIVMKALEKEKERRYGSPAELAADIRRHLTHQPVQASPPGRWYRARKFIRRHRLGVAAATAITLALVVGIGLAASQAIRASRAEARLLVRQGQAEDLISFMVGDLRQKLEPVGRLDILEDVGQKASQYFAALQIDELTDDEVFRRSKALTQIGDVRLSQGNLGAASESFGEALALAADLVRRDPDNGDWLAGLGAAHFWVGNVAWLRRDLSAAEEHFRAYRSASERLAAMDPANTDWQLEVAYAHSNLGSVLKERGDSAGAVVQFRLAETILRHLVVEEPRPLWRRELAGNLSWQGDTLLLTGDLEGALGRHRESKAILEVLLQEDPRNARLRYLLGIGHNQIGYVLEFQGRLNESLASYRSSLELAERLVGDDPTNEVWQRELAIAHQRVGGVTLANGDHEVGLRDLRTACATLRELADVEGSTSVRRLDLATAALELGNGELAADRAGVASHLLAEAQAMVDSVLLAEPEDRRARLVRGSTLLLSGQLASNEGQSAEASSQWELARSLLQELASGSNQPMILDRYARALLYLGRTREALPILHRLAAQGYRGADLRKLAADKGLQVW